MEKAMSIEEKIRKAEEIYNRRNENIYNTYSVRREKKNSSFTKRLIKQLIFCLIIYGVFYIVSNREYFLSQDFKMKIENAAAKNEILNKTYMFIMPHIEKYFHENKSDENIVKTEEQNSIEIQNQTAELTDENIGGSEEDGINMEKTDKSTEKTQEEQDIEYIKNNINFILPINGTISSTFGWRTPTTITVPKYHTGLDIAAPTGTTIKSATDGTIILASSEGDFGNHYKIQIGEAIIIYAHCSKLYLNEGDSVYQGQEIAEVGSTGNSTRSTLAF